MNVQTLAGVSVITDMSTAGIVVAITTTATGNQDVISVEMDGRKERMHYLEEMRTRQQEEVDLCFINFVR